MNRFTKSIKNIQIKKISYYPKLFKFTIIYEPHPTMMNHIDDLEYQKNLMNKLIKNEWFCAPCEILEKSRRLEDEFEK